MDRMWLGLALAGVMAVGGRGTPMLATWQELAAGGAQAPAGPDSATRRDRPRFSRDQLTLAEIEQAGITTNAYDAVQRLRPGWLRNRGGVFQRDGDGSNVVQVWYAQRQLGNVETLREVSLSEVLEIKWVDPIRARDVYGPGNGRGVIAITGR